MAMTILTGDFADAAAISSRPCGGLPSEATPAIPAAPAADAAEPAGAPPSVLPDDARLYLRHVEGGETIRALARETGCHPSTILRRIRRFENRRDDPLVDRAVERGGRDTQADRTELRRVLRRLAEPGAVLAVAAGMEKAIVTRADIRTAVLDRTVAELLALRGWVAIVAQGRISRHAITAAGRAALKAMATGGTAGLPPPSDFDDAARVDPAPAGMAEAAAPFEGADSGPRAAQAHRIMEDRVLDDPDGSGPRRMRVNIAESPLHVMARRRDANGQPFLDNGMVVAGERLREDFELAQMGVRVAQNWDGFMTAGIDASYVPGAGGGGSEVARRRVAEALRELGPGMGDLVLRICCFLEGIEMTERRLGWPARSGKVVLRLALMRLERHYRERYGKFGPLIG
ncbi:DUF6456 domain-containing protein [Paracoccus sp. (in: a-proteobacteria)]|uniref:DUF6456 domain-containing protein n=1 Tax=Paracoccus sp. TaxID=267 RepID=UPI0026DFEBEF|nr:DUF6456 domain-containing protein [Paracoccus sp. (in: a-proteobacteria)]MDO5370912.1 DUF6456 domain-containing protein [Paracoccus sp. (in: a-proteobacteria)]